MEQSKSYFQSCVQPLIIIISLVISAFITSLATGMSAILIPVEMANRGLSHMAIGLMLSFLLLTIAPLSFFLPTILTRIGMRSLFLFSVFARGVAIWLFPQFPDILPCIGILLLYGAGEFTFIFLLQSWMGFTPSKKGSNFLYSLLGLAMSIGIVLSALLVNISGNHTIDPYKAMVAIILCALLPLLPIFLWVPAVKRTTPLPSWKIRFADSKFSVLATLLVGFQIAGIQYCIVIYGMHIGLSFTQSILLLSAFRLGPILFKMISFSFANKFEHHAVMMIGTFLSIACAIYLPLAIYYPFVACAVLCIWGGLVGWIFSIVFAMFRDRYQKEDLLQATGDFTAIYGIGGIMGVVLIGTSITLFGSTFSSTDALPSVINVVNFCFFIFAAKHYIRTLTAKSIPTE